MEHRWIKPSYPAVQFRDLILGQRSWNCAAGGGVYHDAFGGARMDAYAPMDTRAEAALKFSQS